MCVDRIDVCVLCSWEYIYISFIMGIMGYEYFIYSRDMCSDFPYEVLCYRNIKYALAYL